MRQIIFEHEFEKCLSRLGGARAVEAALETIYNSLRRNPYCFPIRQNDWVSIRYARTDQIRDVPPLIVAFTTKAFERSRHYRKPSRCCLHILSASCGLAGFGCAAPVLRKMSLRLPLSRRTCDSSESQSPDLHHRPRHVLRNQCRRQSSLIRCVPLSKRADDPIAVPRNSSSLLATKIADFCNKIWA